VIQYSIIDLYTGLTGRIPGIDVNYILYSVLGGGIFFKLILYIYCININKTANSDIVGALAEDHLNDVWSNSFAVAAAAIAYNTKNGWWVDPFGAILISLVIIYRWYGIIAEQVKKIVGYTAPKEFINSVRQLALDHDSRIDVDCLRVYHFGARCKYNQL
jgi:divalent metal cation (Fe/Co/Zn/Cd) transporter